MPSDAETPEAEIARGEGYEALWGWFGLTRASFLVMSRALMHEMPDEWQAKMAGLLAEWEATFPNMPITDFSVSGKRGNRFVRVPKAMCQYRHPMRGEIDAMRGFLDAQPTGGEPDGR